MTEEKIRLVYDDERYNGFIEKCYSASNESSCHLLVIDSYSIFLHQTVRSNFEGDVKIDKNEILKKYFIAIEYFLGVTKQSVIIMPLNLENRIFDLLLEGISSSADLLWYQFVCDLIRLSQKFNNVILMKPIKLGAFNQSRFFDNGEFLVSDLANEVSALLMPIVTYNCKGNLPSEMKGEKKLLITDLDNTFWGGILGDDGIEGLHYSETSKGKRFFLYQKFLNFLNDNGVILAICSKNDQNAVIQAFESLNFICKQNRFSKIVANWNLKSQNIDFICKELNILPSSAVFIDDNPLEIEEVKINCPDIQTILFDTSQVDSFLLSIGAYFVKPHPSTSVEERKESYKVLEKINLAQSTLSTDGYFNYLTSINMCLSIHKLTGGDRNRAFELLNKTNQFNLNGHRFSIEEFNNLLDNIWTVSLVDQFAEHGIIGIVILKDSCLEQFVLSCRVFSRNIEDAIVDFFKDQIRFVSFCKTLKNDPTAEFLKSRKVVKNIDEIDYINTLTRLEFVTSNQLNIFPGSIRS
ncbi:MAG: HAD-IIIC family phosphatase [Pseudobdellovibrionaceae bacterium]